MPSASGGGASRPRTRSSPARSSGGSSRFSACASLAPSAWKARRAHCPVASASSRGTTRLAIPSHALSSDCTS
ncbi:MAG TPA: hypothetical protein VLQ93_13035, partial [Myxococcaceae bacterium]|nr:hypothetical protein [Myxococcaceae bacterium]